MNIDIEFRPHKGIVQTPMGDYEVTHPQWIVMALNRENESVMHVGYLGTHEGAPFNATLQLAALPKQLQDEIVDRVREKAGAELSVYIPPAATLAEDEDAEEAIDDDGEE